MTTAGRLGRPAAYVLVACCAGLFLGGVIVGALSDTQPALAMLSDKWSEGALRRESGVWLDGVRALALVLNVLPALAGVLAALLVLRGADTWFRCYVGVVLALFGTMNGAIPSVYGAEVGGALGEALSSLAGLAWVSFFPLAYVFPDGRAVPRWTRWGIVGWGLVLPYFLLLDVLGIDDGNALPMLPLLALFGTAAYAAVHRYRKVSGPEQRTQTRGVVAALVLWFGLILLIAATPLGGLQDEASRAGLVATGLSALLSYSVVALIPAAVAVSVLRYRLYDVDVWVNRSLVYLALSAVVVAAYVLVTLLGAALWPDNDLIGPMAIAIALGIGFQPVRSRVQRAVDRFVYGRRKEPYDVLTDLSRQLAAVLPPDEVLQTLVRQVGSALKLPFVGAALIGSPLSVTWPAEATPSSRQESFPLSWQGEELGRLVVGTNPGDDLNAADRDLLDGLAHQAGAAIRAATLNDDLRRSRERILGAREDERRRLQRDLHDGLGPTLASLYQRVDVARTMMKQDPDTAERLLADVGERTRSVVAEIRALVRALRPPELELGLGPAVEAGAGHLNLPVTVHADDLPPLPPAVETAAYRIAMEAITNAARHARARQATVSIQTSGGALEVQVTDDGTGILADSRRGTGLRSMRERADELGGTLQIVGQPNGGTVVIAVLPLREDT